ncbi:MAG: shikimate dehydrogenase [Nitrospinota bacterium]
MSKTIVAGIIGYPIGHSMSAQIYNFVATNNDIDLIYTPFEVKPNDLAKAIEALKVLNIKGVNVTIPYKEQVIPLLDEISDEAKLIGAVNIIVNDNRRLIGFNSDARGFAKSIAVNSDFTIQGKKGMIYGAGGAAKAVAIALATEKIGSITIVNRDLEKGVHLANNITEHFPTRVNVISLNDKKSLTSTIESSDIIINCSSVGMKGGVENDLILNFGPAKKECLVIDIVYNPLETDFLKKAREQNLLTIDGLEMLIYQGEITFRHFTNSDFPVDQVRKMLVTKLK